jgi:hypothetical protein
MKQLDKMRSAAHPEHAVSAIEQGRRWNNQNVRENDQRIQAWIAVPGMQHLFLQRHQIFCRMQFCFKQSLHSKDGVFLERAAVFLLLNRSLAARCKFLLHNALYIERSTLTCL